MTRNFEDAFLRLLNKQDEHSFNTLYLQTVDIFFRYLKSNFFIDDEDCKDIISDFYVKLWNALPKYNPEQNISGYMRTIFKNTVKDFFKKNKELPFTALASDEENYSFEENLMDESDIRDFLEQDFLLEHIQEAMKKLDPLSKEILTFKYIEGKSNKEIESVLDISQEAIRQRISRAFKSLKELLAEGEE